MVVNMYIRLLWKYNFNDTFARMLVSHESLTFIKKHYHEQIAGIGDINLQSHPMLYVYRLVRHMYDWIVSRLRESEHSRYHIENEITYCFSCTVYIGYLYKIQSVTVLGHDITVLTCDDYPRVIVIRSIGQYSDLIDALSYL